MESCSLHNSHNSVFYVSLYPLDINLCVTFSYVSSKHYARKKLYIGATLQSEDGVSEFHRENGSTNIRELGRGN